MKGKKMKSLKNDLITVPVNDYRYLPGKKMFTDFADTEMEAVNTKTGEICKTCLFAAMLASSGMIYAELMAKNSSMHFTGIMNALNFFHGVPETIVSDFSFENSTLVGDFAKHYKVAIELTRPSNFSEKPCLEIILWQINEKLSVIQNKNSVITFAETNTNIMNLLKELNNVVLPNLEKSRSDIFESIERFALRALPDKPYTFVFHEVRKVNIDSHLAIEGRYYSVYPELIGESVEVKISEDTVEVFFKGKKVAEHQRIYGRTRYSTKHEHMSFKGVFNKYSGKDLISWASSIGPNSAKIVEKILSAEKYPEHGYRKCLGILSLAKSNGRKRLEKACQMALEKGSPRYISVKTFLQQQQEE